MKNLEMVVYIKIAVSLDLSPCKLTENYQRFKRIFLADSAASHLKIK